QIFTRARQHLHADDAHRGRHEVSADQGRALVRSFIAATQSGDLDQLMQLLAPDVVFCGDGGDKATAVREPITGRDRIAPLLLWLFARTRSQGIHAEPVEVNGGPGLISRDRQGKIVSVLSIEEHDGVIDSLRSVVNPDKLSHLGPVSDFLRIR
ncbi:MAG TPA: nuclear transport factor 2 family protein, partial [Acidimicrobiales bacterium]|nr:nuclear transport factor 2 family protein [Acidimicrobiales bacterium]